MILGVGALAFVGSGVLGMRMVPDTELYAEGRYWRAPIGSGVGWLFGFWGIVGLTVGGCMACAYCLRDSRSVPVVVATLGAVVLLGSWAGLDAAGAAVVAAGVRWSRGWGSRAGAAVVASLVHPVAGLAYMGSWLAVGGRRQAYAVMAFGGMAAAASGLSFTHGNVLRYLLPGIVAWGATWR